MLPAAFFMQKGERFMALIDVSHLTFGYEGSFENVFEDVSFQIDTTWRLGFTGRNGRGKTTFLRLLTGAYPYRGTITAPAAFDYFPPDLPDERMTAMQAARALAPGLEDWQLERETGLLGVQAQALARPMSTLSGGERTKVLLALMFLRAGRFPLIDEPTNHLDMRARAQVAAYLRRKDGFILVSHDRAFLDACVDHVLYLGRTGVEVAACDFSTFLQNRAQREQYERTQSERLRREVARLSQAARDTAGWSDALERTKNSAGDSGYVGHKSAKMMRRAKNAERRRERALEDKKGLLREVEEAPPLTMHPLAFRQERLAEALDLCVRYDGREVTRDVRFTLRRGGRVALQGPNGCGKTSILRLIAGEDVPHGGVLRLASGLRVSYVPQDMRFLSGSLADYARDCGVDLTLLLTTLRALDFARELFERDMRGFSAGQKKKVLLARSLCEEAHLFVWDEPLNYIDLYSRMQLEALIAQRQPSMVFVEHDRAFVDAVATERVTLRAEVIPSPPGAGSR